MLAQVDVPWSEILHLTAAWLVLAAIGGVGGLWLWRNCRLQLVPADESQVPDCRWTLGDFAVVLFSFVFGEYAIHLGVRALRGDAGLLAAADPSSGSGMSQQHLALQVADVLAQHARLLLVPESPASVVLISPTEKACAAVLLWMKDQAVSVLWGTLVSRVVLVLAFVAYLRWRVGASWRDLGITTAGLSYSLWLGYFVWLVMTPLVFTVFIALRLLPDWFGSAEPHLVEMLLTLDRGWGPWLLALVVAGVTAPVFEELLLRGIMQPLFVARPQYADALLVTGLVIAVLLGLGFGSDGSTGRSLGWGPLAFLATVGPGYLVFEALMRSWLPLPGTARAVYATSLFFAVLHAGVWPTPIPLFLLSLALGVVAFRSQNLTGPIVMHGAFNLVSLLPLIPLWTG
jgi:membrane protease YdiL (CAAX protease family)